MKTKMGCLFYGCYELKEIYGIEKFNTNKVTNMRNMFEHCLQLKFLIYRISIHQKLKKWKECSMDVES